MLYNAGVDVKSAQVLLVHSDISVTLKIYTHLSQMKTAIHRRAERFYLRGSRPADQYKFFRGGKKWVNHLT